MSIKVAYGSDDATGQAFARFFRGQWFKDDDTQKAQKVQTFIPDETMSR